MGTYKKKESENGIDFERLHGDLGKRQTQLKLFLLGSEDSVSWNWFQSWALHDPYGFSTLPSYESYIHGSDRLEIEVMEKRFSADSIVRSRLDSHNFPKDSYNYDSSQKKNCCDLKWFPREWLINLSWEHRSNTSCRPTLKGIKKRCCCYSTRKFV